MVGYEWCIYNMKFSQNKASQVAYIFIIHLSAYIVHILCIICAL